MKFTISARQTNSANTADGYLEWQEVDEWNAERLNNIREEFKCQKRISNIYLKLVTTRRWSIK